VSEAHGTCQNHPDAEAGRRHEQVLDDSMSLMRGHVLVLDDLRDLSTGGLSVWRHHIEYITSGEEKIKK
jgi:hypothetical protein